MKGGGDVIICFTLMRYDWYNFNEDIVYRNLRFL